MIHENIKRHPDESYWDYLGRLYEQRSEYDLTCQEIADIMNHEFGKTCGESKYRKEIRAFNSGRDYERERLMRNNRSAYLQQIADQKRELQMERYKIQTEKAETNKWLREAARDEMIMEKIIDTIEKQKSVLEFPTPIQVGEQTGEWVLAFGDAHYGKEFVLYDLDGAVLNAYNEDIFIERMNKLLAKTIGIVQKESISALNVFDLGDNTDGILRVSQLMTLKYGVIESAIRYAYFLSAWLNELSKHVHVRFSMATGNHTELRMLGQPKGAFKEDNMLEVIKLVIELRLKDNQNFEFVHNPTGLIFTQLAGKNILGVHGECGSLDKAIDGFSNTYKKQIDYVIGGHYHHGKSEDIGRRRAAISVRSIIGIDEYSLSLNKTSDAGATMLCFEEDEGNAIVYNICLN